MSNRLFALVLLCLLPWSSRAAAQDAKWEVSGFGGWTLADGVSVPSEANRAPNSEFYNRVEPKDSLSLGFSLGRLIGPRAEVGFIYGFQPSKLVFGSVEGGGAAPTPNFELGDLNISTFHGYFALNGGNLGDTVRPFVFAGAGFTHYGETSSPDTNSFNGIPSATRFSPTFGVGAKVRSGQRIAMRFAVRWTPTAVTESSVGWWCGNWGCYVNPDDHNIASQFEFTGGVIFRF